MTIQAADEPRFRVPHTRPEQILESLAPEEVRQHLHALQALTEAVLAHLSLPELLRELLNRLRSVLSVDEATVLLCSEGGQTLEVRESRGLEEEVEQHVTIPMGHGIAGAVAARRQAVIVDEVDQIQTVSPWLRRLSSMMVAPLIAEGDLLGVLHVGTISPRHFTARDLYLMQVVADRVALAIRNALTYDQLAAKANALEEARTEAQGSEDRFRKLFERSPLPMWVFEVESQRILDVNEAAVRQYGWTRDELRAMTLRDLRAPREITRLQTVGRDRLGGRVRRGLLRHRRKDGTILDVEVTTSDIEYEGRPARVALVVDVTAERAAAAERERLVAEVERQRVLLQTVTDNATSALVLLAPDGRGIWWNPAWEEMTGFTAEEMRGRVLHDLIHHTHPDGTPFPYEDCPIDHALPQGVEVRGYEDVFVRKDGSFFPVVCAARPVWEGDIPVATVVEVRDVTAHRAAEEALRRAKEEAEAASRAKSEFLAAMSHELRTPLNAVIGYADLVLSGIPEPAPPATARQVERISLSSRHLLSLIEEILTFTRLEAGREKVEAHPFDACAVLDEVEAIIAPLARARDLQLRISAPPGPLPMTGDARKLRQILVNLLDNAVKFTDRGTIDLQAATEEGELVLRVRDTGLGIAPEHQERIFEPFWQVDQSSTRTAGGTGLGLALALRLVRAMGGQLSVQSEPGRGSTFTARLPLSPPEPTHPDGGETEWPR